MPAQQSLPGLIAEGLGKVRGANDVGEYKRLPGSQRAAPPVLCVPEVALGGLDIQSGAEPAELIEGRAVPPCRDRSSRLSLRAPGTTEEPPGGPDGSLALAFGDQLPGICISSSWPSSRRVW